MLVSRKSFAVATAFVVAYATQASAQPSVSLSAVGAHLSHELLGSMHGGSLTIGWGAPNDGWTFHIAAERMTGSGTRTDVLCVDHIPPGGCNPEIVSDKSVFQSIWFGVGRSIFSAPRSWVSVAAEIPVSRAKADTYGQTTGRFFPARKTLIGARGGLRAGVVPIAAWPLTIDVSGSLGKFFVPPIGTCADCYDPFSSEFSSRSVQIGVAWRSFR